MIDLDQAARLIAGHEGFRSFVYDDVAPNRPYDGRAVRGTLTIGYGETRPDLIERYRSGITEPEAFELLRQRVAGFAAEIAKGITAELNANQWAAVTSLAYNIGTGAFATSTVRKRINANPSDPAAVREAWSWWNKAGGQVLEGLSRRRREESDLYETPVGDDMAADLAHLHPIFRARVEASGHAVVSGARSTERQRQLYEDYQAGRGNPANRPGTSWHEYGAGIPGGEYALAVDFAGPPYPHGAPGLCWPVPGEPWHAQPTEITERQRVAGAEQRLPAPQEEDFLMTLTPAQAAELYETTKATNAALGRVETAIRDQTTGIARKLDEVLATLKEKP